MKQLIEEIDYLRIKQEFNETQDYRDFILRYYKIEHIEVAYLIAQANWFLILEEDSKITNSLNGFIRKYYSDSDDRIKNLVVNAMLTQLKLNQIDSAEDAFLDQCNELIDYAYNIKGKDEGVDRALVFSYWFKAQSIRTKDWRKSQYFYNKVIALSRNINDDEYHLYSIKAEIAKVALYVQYNHSDDVRASFYKILNKYAEHHHPVIIHLIDDLINVYMYYLVYENEWFDQLAAAQQFMLFLNTESSIQKIILNSTDRAHSVPRLLWIAYAYWCADQETLYEQYLLRFFSFFDMWESVLESFKEYLQFNSVQDRKAFLGYADELHKRYVNLVKYRKLFRSDKI